MLYRRWRWVVSTVVLGAASQTVGRPVLLAQQDTVVIDGTPTACSVGLELIASLGGPDLPFELATTSMVAMTSDGRLLVAPTYNEGQIAVFDASGHFERTVGRRGEGPGEYGRIRTVLVGPGDTVWVLERATATRLRPDFTFIDRHFLDPPAADWWTIAPSGNLVLLATRMGAGRPPSQLHIVGPEGRFVTSFAPAPRAFVSEGDLIERLGSIAPSKRYHGLWFAKANRYALQLFVHEELRRVVIRNVPWFRPWEGLLPLEGLATPPRPAIESLAERSDGLLTVLIRHADAKWEENRSQFVDRSSPEGGNPAMLPRQLIFDSTIEVIDPERGTVVCRGESGEYLRGPIGDGTLVYAPTQDIVGRVHIRIFRTVLSAH